MSCCRLETERLLLRPHEASDAARIALLLGDFDVAKNLSTVPHPYTEDDARSFIARTAEDRAKGEAHPFAVTLKADATLVGGCGLRLKDDGLFEFGYWLGKPYWGVGYASEAARRLAAFAFHDLDVSLLKAGYFHDNPASGRVLGKLGAVPAGADQHDCMARGHTVYCHLVKLERATFGKPRR